ncbi:MAG TPA: CocE/NonD family hydrolase [Acidimicrobiales bacterium]|nr:CocE/NonD family hydrolase [Acidimicrobiales bacterium]
MRPRGHARLLAVAVFASLLSPVALKAPPAAAHGSCTSVSETSHSSSTAWSDGETVNMRVVRPVSSASCTKPSSGWPLLVYLHGYTGNRCSHTPFATRSDMAKWGYVVLSFTSRGNPSADGVGDDGCDATTDALDALDDNGNDFTGPRDRLDVTQLIDWAADHYTPTGCSSPCVDENKVGVTGFSYGGMRSWAVGVGSPTNPQFDSRVKAIAPTASGLFFENVKNLSNDGAATPTLRQRANNYNEGWAGNQGWYVHTDRQVQAANGPMHRGLYLNDTSTTAYQAARDWWEDRFMVDDNPDIDRVGDIDIPVFVMNGFLDGLGAISNQAAVEAFDKIPHTDKYMYLGSCTHAFDPCHANNATKMRDALHRFMDRHVRCHADATCLSTCGSACEVRPPGTTACGAGGPCVLYTVPTKWVSSTNNPWYTDNWEEKSGTAWPPAGSSTIPALYLRDNGTLSTSQETIAGSSKQIKNNRVGPWVADACVSLFGDVKYDSDEFQQYDTPAFEQDAKLGKLEADLYLSSDNTRLQVNVDLYLLSSTGTELTRIWQGTEQIAPVVRNATVNQVYRFKFLPGGEAWTVAAGQKLRIKVSSKYRAARPGEPLPGTYTLHHNPTHPSSITLTFVP